MARKLAAPKQAPKVMKGAVLRPSAGAEARYNAELQRLIAKMTRETERQVTALFKSPVAVESHVTTDASIASQSRILMNALQSQFVLMFRNAARGLSEQMVNEVQTNSATGLQRSLKEISANVTLKSDILKRGPVGDITKAAINENVGLIKSIPEQYLGKVRRAVMTSITTGNGLQDLQPFMEKQKGITQRHARNMALDQTRKTYNAINKGRMQNAGVGKFEWIHTGGSQKPRQDHIEMSGNVYSFDDLPVIDERTGERGIPGQAPNCRCTMRPVLDFGVD